MVTGRKILICPLEWGLGHAGRIIPLAKRLQELGNHIVIGTGEEHRAFLKRELPFVEFIHFPGFKPVYSEYLPQYLTLLFQTPKLLFHIIREHKNLGAIIKENSIEIVISDNRFGMWNRKIRSVYITHMPLIPFPKSFFFLEFTGKLIHRAIIKKFDFCFIPDLPGNLNLSGRLSHGVKLPGNVRYIGILSRFTALEGSAPDNPVEEEHNTIILSGPEPQRTILREKLASILRKENPVSVFLEGKPGDGYSEKRAENIISVSHLPARKMHGLIKTSKGVIARAGYTSIMELVSMGTGAMLIPTPGQTEQEYLAGYLSEKGWFITVKQNDLCKPIQMLKTEVPDEFSRKSPELLELALKELLS
jgi:spore coat polysaccharide biosynthesis predicted glycosyltransferase SpsG